MNNPSSSITSPATMPSTGETSLTNLLQTLTVTVSPKTYTFITLPPHTYPSNLRPEAPIQMLFREPTEDQMDDDYRLDLLGHLTGVPGFMAVVAKALADVGVSANVIAAYLHDHVFVQADRVEVVKAAIEKVAEDARMQTRS
ncbi:hypothetical protein LTR24_005573 [Lithohypha guttulata]|uniref:ACT domain-containing protein n=1 Tax=Lithohypha guttulata TaxID=1690604 RepID=A0ABR0K8G7_9EURO|nr:hypothetical protein LTR24_005573 [Lithohypha guttulata]